MQRQMFANPRGRCPLFVELCAGTAAVSLQLHAGPSARPPVSRMGSKRGYAHAILRALGLWAGQGQQDGTRYLWCEPDPGVRLLLHAYTDRALAQEAAAIIRGWADEDPRALWERLREEGPARCPDAVEAREVARWLLLGWQSYRQGFPDSGFRRTAGGAWPDRPPDGETVAERLESITQARGTIVPDARTIDPREVARAARIITSNRLISVDGETWRNTGQGGSTFGGPEFSEPIQRLAESWAACPTAPAAILPDAREVDPPQLPPGTVVYMDPPYSSVSAVVPPMLAAKFLPPGSCDSSEGDAALDASGLHSLREPVGHLRVAIAEMLRAAGVEPQVLGSIVERVVIDVVDDLVWCQWATDEALHHKAVLRDSPTVVASVAVPTLKPSLAIVHAASSRQLLPLRRHLRDFAIACEALSSPATKFTHALAWASGATLACGWVVPPHKGGSADLARDIERHCRLRVRVRQDTNTTIARPASKTTGYANDLPRPEVVALARRWQAAGATVCISEAEPIPELVADGWHAVDITHTRKGQRRTFSKQQAEWLTMSRPPAWTP